VGIISKNEVPFKYEEVSPNVFEIPNLLPKSFRFLAPLRREYGFILRAKQAIKASHGLLSEKQFKQIVCCFKQVSGGKYGDFLIFLEMQLVVVLVRAGLVTSFFQARQILVSGLVFVNGDRVFRAS